MRWLRLLLPPRSAFNPSKPEPPVALDDAHRELWNAIWGIRVAQAGTDARVYIYGVISVGLLISVLSYLLVKI